MNQATTKQVNPQVKQAIRDKYAWPGGYPLYLISHDCATVCVECGKKEYTQIAWAARYDHHDSWHMAGAEINWEDPDLYCDHCDKLIESAYAEE